MTIETQHTDKPNLASPQNTATTWNDLLAKEKKEPYFKSIMQEILQQRQQGISIYPPKQHVFAAFKLTALSNLRVVIIGQDPYHGAGQAHGLAFSVPHSVRIPPSLRNIYLELKQDLGIKPANHGNLQPWAKQGVLLLNTSLTVVAAQPGSHARLGWQHFTDNVIKAISQSTKNTVFLLWGAHAKSKQNLINTHHHHVLSAAHPSPFSAHRGFLGCRHFSKCNQLLKAAGKKPIEWTLEDSPS